jgi:hypothetical protein
VSSRNDKRKTKTSTQPPAAKLSTRAPTDSAAPVAAIPTDAVVATVTTPMVASTTSPRNREPTKPRRSRLGTAQT